LKKIDFALLT